MVSADQLHASEVRIQEAKESTRPFGGLGMTLSGDFLQLPPVDPGDTQKSLATALDAIGFLDAGPEEPGAKDLDKKRSKLAQSVQGLQLWQRIRHVVCLDVNVRAPGPLSELLAEMRAGKGISDRIWNMYMERVMQREDPRLSEKTSPFGKYEWQFIVHRHKIRVHRSLVNARDATSAAQKPLYIVQARDEATNVRDARKMDDVREELLRMASPRDTQGLPGVLPLYVGMRLTLQTKDGGFGNSTASVLLVTLPGLVLLCSFHSRLPKCVGLVRRVGLPCRFALLLFARQSTRSSTAGHTQKHGRTAHGHDRTDGGARRTHTHTQVYDRTSTGVWVVHVSWSALLVCRAGRP